MPSSTSAMMPAHRMTVSGIGSEDSTSVPSRVKTLKLSTRPATTRYGRRVSLTLDGLPAGESRSLRAAREEEDGEHWQYAR